MTEEFREQFIEAMQEYCMAIEDDTKVPVIENVDNTYSLPLVKNTSGIFSYAKIAISSFIDIISGAAGFLSARVAQSFSPNEKAQLVQNIGPDNTPTQNSQNLVTSGGVHAAVATSVRVNDAQNFSDSQKAQARTNIGALGEITKQQFDAIFND